MKKTIATLMMAGSFNFIQAQSTQTNAPGTYNGNDGNNTNNQKVPSNQTVSPTYTGTSNDGMYNGDKTYQDTANKKTPQNKNKNSNNPNNKATDPYKGTGKTKRDSASHK